VKKLLHIIATPREDGSRTLQVSNAFLRVFKDKHPDWMVEELNLFKEDLPSLTLKRIDGKYILLGGKDLSGELKEAWEEIVAHIGRFLAADAYLLSVPMWNFSIPYKLKHYLDVIIQPKYLFRYTEKGPEGLVKDRKMAVVTSRGGDYSSEGMRQYDMQEPYLRAVFGFAGITDITFINAQPMDMSPELRERKVGEARAAAGKIAENF